MTEKEFYANMTRLKRKKAKWSDGIEIAEENHYGRKNYRKTR